MNKTIENLKKLKSFHNGSYGADIDKAVKALEQNPKYRKEAKRWKNKALGQRPKINPEGNVVYGRDGNLYELTLSNGKEYEQEPMRDATPEELKSVNDYIKSISKPTGVKFDFDEEQEQIDFVKPHRTVGKLISVDVLDTIREEIIKYEGDCRLSVGEYPSCDQCTDNVFESIYGILDKYKAESEG